MRYEDWRGEKLSAAEERFCDLLCVFSYVRTCEVADLAMLVDEIRERDVLLVWNPNTKSLDGVDSVSINGGSLQFNIREYGDE